MRTRIVWTIFRKEFLESLRDRRTLIMLVGIPLLIYPMMILLSSKLVESEMEASKDRPSTIAVWGVVPEPLTEYLRSREKLKVTPWLGAPEDLRKHFEAGRVTPPRFPTPLEERDERNKKEKPEPPETPVLKAARQVILERKADAVIVAWPGFAEAFVRDGTGQVSVYFDSVRTDSRTAEVRLGDELRYFRKITLERRDRERGLESGYSQAMDARAQNVAPKSRKSGMFLGLIIPALLIAMSVTGGFYSAIDMTAGEKERGTMQTLLCAPVSPIEIIGGKFLAVWAISLIGTLCNVVSMALTFTRLTLGGGEITVSPWNFVLAFGLLIPISCMSSALFLAVAVFARGFKDAQSMMTPLLLVMIFPLVLVNTPGTTLNAWTAFVPIANIALLSKGLFLGEVKPDDVFLTLLASTIYATLALLFAARVFERENLLLGGKESFRAVLSMDGRGKGVPTPTMALVSFAVVQVALFYGSLLLMRGGFIKLILGSQLGLLLLPTLAIIGLLKLRPVETLQLRMPGWRGILGSAMVGVSAWVVVSGVTLRLLPPPESLSRALEKVLMIDDRSVPLWGLWVLAALTPGLCEELFFRGLVMSGLRGLGKWPAIVLAALLFGVAHASIYRLLPTLCLGVVLGYATWQSRSVFASAILHALNNGLALTLARTPEMQKAFGVSKTSLFMPWPQVLVFSVIMLAGLAILRRSPDREKRIDSGKPFPY